MLESESLTAILNFDFNNRYEIANNTEQFKDKFIKLDPKIV